MVPRIKPVYAVTGIVLAAMAAVAGIADLAVSQPALSNALPKQSLFGIAANMQSTTGSMLDHTKALQGRVQTVNEELNQLTTQEQILNQQQQTSRNMANALSRQQQLTANGVALMQSILTHEKATRSITGAVAAQTSGLSNNVLQSESQLSGLASAIQVSGQESIHLNGQMDELLSTLNTSLQEFRMFGQVDQLLTNPLSKGSLLPSLAQPVPGSVTKTITNPSGTAVGTGSNATNNILGNTLNGLGGIGNTSH